jgi:hypothetical protein
MMEAMPVATKPVEVSDPRGQPSDLAETRPELFEMLSWVPGLIAAVVVLMAQILGRSGISGFGLLTVMSVLVVGLGFVVLRRGSASIVVRVRVSRRDVAAIAAIAGAAALLLFITLRGSLFAPMTFSVDAAHHGATIEWMRAHQIIPSGTKATIDTIGGQAGYPAGSYTLASVLSWAARIAPVRAMWLFSVALVVAIWMICASLVEAVVGKLARPFVLVPVIFSLAAWRFTLGMITRDFFFAQLVGIWLAFSAVAAIAWWSTHDVGNGTLIAVTGLCTAACLFTYPQTAPIPLLALIVELLRVRITKRSLAIILGLAVVGVGGAFAFARLLGIDRTVLSGVGEGERAPIQLSTAGGWLAVWLLIIGAFDLVVSLRHRRGSRAIVGGLAAPALLALGLASLRLPIFGSLPVTGYRIEKNLYTLAPFGMLLATIGIVRALTELIEFLRPRLAPHAKAVLFSVGSASVAAGSFFASTPRTLSSRPVISTGQYQAMNWARHHAEPTDIGMSFSDLAAYHLWWLKSGRSVADVNAAMGAPLRMTKWDDWPSKEPERFLVTSGWLAQEFQKIPGVTVRFSSGDAVVLERPQ